MTIGDGDGGGLGAGFGDSGADGVGDGGLGDGGLADDGIGDDGALGTDASGDDGALGDDGSGDDGALGDDSGLGGDDGGDEGDPGLGGVGSSVDGSDGASQDDSDDPTSDDSSGGALDLSGLGSLAAPADADDWWGSGVPGNPYTGVSGAGDGAGQGPAIGDAPSNPYLVGVDSAANPFSGTTDTGPYAPSNFQPSTPTGSPGADALAPTVVITPPAEVAGYYSSTPSLWGTLTTDGSMGDLPAGHYNVYVQTVGDGGTVYSYIPSPPPDPTNAGASNGSITVVGPQSAPESAPSGWNPGGGQLPAPATPGGASAPATPGADSPISLQDDPTLTTPLNLAPLTLPPAPQSSPAPTVQTAYPQAQTQAPSVLAQSAMIPPPALVDSSTLVPQVTQPLRYDVLPYITRVQNTGFVPLNTALASLAATENIGIGVINAVFGLTAWANHELAKQGIFLEALPFDAMPEFLMEAIPYAAGRVSQELAGLRWIENVPAAPGMRAWGAPTRFVGASELPLPRVGPQLGLRNVDALPFFGNDNGLPLVANDNGLSFVPDFDGPSLAANTNAFAAPQTWIASSTSQARRVYARLLDQSTDPRLAELQARLLTLDGRFYPGRLAGQTLEYLREHPEQLEMMHVVSDKAGGTNVVIGSAYWNQWDNIATEGAAGFGSFIENVVVDVYGLAIELRTAIEFEAWGWLPPGTVAHAPRLQFAP
jgi:hypothetical protein